MLPQLHEQVTFVFKKPHVPRELGEASGEESHAAGYSTDAFEVEESLSHFRKKCHIYFFTSFSRENSERHPLRKATSHASPTRL